MSQAAAIEKNYDVLLRCTTINCYVIDCLKAEDIIDRMQEAELRTKRNSIKQCDLLFTWLKEVSTKKYESFLEVMNDTEQEHVANLLCGSTEDDNLPLSEVRHRRLNKIRPKIAHVISIDIEMIAELRKFRAISRTDAEDIRAEKTDYAQISKLISAIMRRSNHCYNSLREVLTNTRQKAAAAYLSEGEMLAVHVNNNRPDMDEILSSAFNEVIKNNSDVDTMSCVKEQLTEMNGLSLYPVKAIPGQSIVVFVYCETVQNGVTFTQLFNSGRLLQTLDAILNRLLLKFELHNTKELDSRISLEEEEIETLEEFTGIEGWMRKRPSVPKPVGKINGCDAVTQTAEDHFTMNKTDRRLLTAEEDTVLLEGQSATPKMGKVYQNPSRPRSPQVMDELLQKHRDFLVDRIDPDFGLLDNLQASRTLTREAVHKIKLKDNTTEDKNRILLDFILKDKKADEFISALRDSGQNHLANYLSADGEYEETFGDDWPLSESEISRLDINHECLVDLLDTRDLCTRLYSEGVINNRQNEFISFTPTNAEKTEALLDILTKCSLRQYKKTIDCLKYSNQGCLADILSKGGVIVRVHNNLEDAVGNVDEQEEEIISKIKSLLEHRPVEEATRILDLIQQKIIVAKKGQ